MADISTKSRFRLRETSTCRYLTQSFHAAGQTTAELAAEITDAYKSQKIYTNPVVTVIAEERFINVGGDVRSPSNVAYRPDLTLMSTINSCGGFTEYANRRAVRIIRGQQVHSTSTASRRPRTPAPIPPFIRGTRFTFPAPCFRTASR